MSRPRVKHRRLAAGHSTRPLEEFIAMISSAGVAFVVVFGVMFGLRGAGRPA
jgi:hypothetical protein